MRWNRIIAQPKISYNIVQVNLRPMNKLLPRSIGYNKSIKSSFIFPKDISRNLYEPNIHFINANFNASFRKTQSASFHSSTIMKSLPPLDEKEKYFEFVRKGRVKEILEFLKSKNLSEIEEYLKEPIPSYDEEIPEIVGWPSNENDPKKFEKLYILIPKKLYYKGKVLREEKEEISEDKRAFSSQPAIEEVTEDKEIIEYLNKNLQIDCQKPEKIKLTSNIVKYLEEKNIYNHGNDIIHRNNNVLQKLLEYGELEGCKDLIELGDITSALTHRNSIGMTVVDYALIYHRRKYKIDSFSARNVSGNIDILALILAKNGKSFRSLIEERLGVSENTRYKKSYLEAGHKPNSNFTRTWGAEELYAACSKELASLNRVPSKLMLKPFTPELIKDYMKNVVAALFEYAYFGKLFELKRLIADEKLDEEINLIPADIKGFTILHYAIANNQVEIVKYLLMKDEPGNSIFERNYQNQLNALDIAIMNNCDEEIIEEICNKAKKLISFDRYIWGDDSWNASGHNACFIGVSYGELEGIKKALKNGYQLSRVNKEGKNLYQMLIKWYWHHQNATKLAEWLFRHGCCVDQMFEKELEELKLPSYQQQIELRKWYNNKIKYDDVSQLSHAGYDRACYLVINGNLDDLKKELDMRGKDRNINLKNKRGMNLLHYAVLFKQQKIIDYLLKEKDIDVNVATGFTIREIEEMPTEKYKWYHENYIEECNFSDGKLWSYKGNTALHLAARHSSTNLIEKLYRKHACLDLENNYGQTPLRVAELYQSESAIKILRELGAKNRGASYSDIIISHKKYLSEKEDFLRLARELDALYIKKHNLKKYESNLHDMFIKSYSHTIFMEQGVKYRVNISNSYEEDQNKRILYKINSIIFQGGGMKGFGHLGALEELNKEEYKHFFDLQNMRSDVFLSQIQNAGGASIGAFISLLFVLNKNAIDEDNIKRFLKAFAEVVNKEAISDDKKAGSLEKRKFFIELIELYKQYEMKKLKEAINPANTINAILERINTTHDTIITKIDKYFKDPQKFISKLRLIPVLISLPFIVCRYLPIIYRCLPIIQNEENKKVFKFAIKFIKKMMAMPDLESIDDLSEYGLIKGTEIRKAIDELIQRETHLKNTTFLELHNAKNVRELKIVAHDLINRKIEVFSHLTTPNVIVSHAILAAMAIPIVFSPQPRMELDNPIDRTSRHIKGYCYVDGGLLDNYPLWLYGNTKATKMEENVIGMRLVDRNKRKTNLDPQELVNKNVNSFYFKFLFDSFLAFAKQESDHFWRNEKDRSIYIDYKGHNIINFKVDREKETIEPYVSEDTKSELKLSGKEAVKEFYSFSILRGHVQIADEEKEIELIAHHLSLIAYGKEYYDSGYYRYYDQEKDFKYIRNHKNCSKIIYQFLHNDVIVSHPIKNWMENDNHKIDIIEVQTIGVETSIIMKTMSLFKSKKSSKCLDDYIEDFNKKADSEKDEWDKKSKLGDVLFVYDSKIKKRVAYLKCFDEKNKKELIIKKNISPGSSLANLTIINTQEIKNKLKDKIIFNDEKFSQLCVKSCLNVDKIDQAKKIKIIKRNIEKLSELYININHTDHYRKSVLHHVAEVRDVVSIKALLDLNRKGSKILYVNLRDKYNATPQEIFNMMSRRGNIPREEIDSINLLFDEHNRCLV